MRINSIEQIKFTGTKIPVDVALSLSGMTHGVEATKMSSAISNITKGHSNDFFASGQDIEKILLDKYPALKKYLKQAKNSWEKELADLSKASGIFKKMDPIWAKGQRKFNNIVRAAGKNHNLKNMEI